MTAFPTTVPPGTGQRHLVLLGAGQSHLNVLAQWAMRPVAGVQVTLVTPHPGHLNAYLLPGLVAGQYPLEDCTIALEPLIHNSGIRWIQRHAAGLDAQAQTILLDDGSKLPYDWLSINTGLTQDRSRVEQSMPGAREHGLFIRPPETFAALWPRVTELPAEDSHSVAVVGGDITAIELAMAIRHRLPHAAVTLITDGNAVASNLPVAMQSCIERALKKRRITILIDTVTGLQRGEALLGCGARLACDIPVVASDAGAPSWLVPSGLALDQTGLILVDGCQRSTSHANVYAAGGVCTQNGSAGLYGNLTAATAGLQPQPLAGKHAALQSVSCGDGSAIACWHGLCLQGRLPGWWKQRADRLSVQRYRHPVR